MKVSPEEALKGAELRYRRLFEAVRDGILLVDFKTGMILDVNQFLIDLLGYTKKDFLEKHIWDIGAFKDIAESKERFKELQNKKFVQYENLPLETKSGKEVEVEFVSYAYRVSETEMIQLIQCNVRNITEYKKREDELLLKTSLLKAQLSSSMDGVLAVDMQGKTLLYNQRFAEMWKIPSKVLSTKSDEKMLGFILEQLVDPDQFINKVKELYSRPLEKAEDKIEFKDGRTFERYSVPLIDNAKNVHGRIWYFRDVTDVLEHTRELERMNELMVGRELKMAELKNRIRELESGKKS